MSKSNFKEECWLLYGLRIYTKFGLSFIGFQKYHSSGDRTSVEMDFNKADNALVIGWYHSHPGVSNVKPSGTDNSTMRSWVKAVYKPYLCGIRCGTNSACYCYAVAGLNKEKVTIVKKSNVRIYFLGPFFFGIQEEGSK